MTMVNEVVFLLDVDNTLLDNDRIVANLSDHLAQEFGEESRDRYWEIFEALRVELGYADYLGALQRYRVGAMNDPRLLMMSSFLVDYPFAECLYPGALDVIAYLRRHGPTVILSDGDVVFQPRKVQRSGLWDAVEGRVLIYLHKEQMLDDVERRYPAHHYVMADDKLRILASMKKTWADRLTTVFPRQGHYARDPENIAPYPPADITIEHIGELINYSRSNCMLVTFTTKAYADITMFGDIALAILQMIGHSATVPGVILAPDVPAALSRLTAAVEAGKASLPAADKDVDEPAVSMAHRAFPLIDLLAAAAKAEADVMWK